MLNDASLKNCPKEVEDAILRANHPIEMRQLMIAAMQKAGVVAPLTRDSEFDIRLTPQAAASPAPVMPAARPAQAPTCMRIIYPHGNNRFELYATSEAELDAQERQIMAMFGGQR
jgi:hypothetical protein